MRYRPIGGEPLDPRLDRHIPDDFEHLERYPLTATTAPVKPVPVVLGINWYTAFDSPERDSHGQWWVGTGGSLGNIRGGHCVCLEPGDPQTGVREQDTVDWWSFYDQGAEGACVGFGSSRMMSLLNRRQYFARWLWDRAKEADEWPDTQPGDDNGTTVRAALSVLKARGHVPWQRSYQDLNDEPADAFPRSGLHPVAGDGIAAYRWATTVEQIHAVLRSPASDRAGAVRVLNSWGRGYPHRVWMPDTVLQRLLDEQGEAGLVTDR